MSPKLAKVAPLFIILVMTLSAVAYTPAATATAASLTTTSQQTHAEYTPSPIGSTWVNDSSAYATYNGHIHTNYQNGPGPSTQTEYLVTANLSVAPNSAKTYSNLSVALFDLFTGAPITGMQGLWYNISTTNSLVVQSMSGSPGLIGYPSFLYVPRVKSMHLGQEIAVSSPFNQSAITFELSKGVMVLGVQTAYLNASWIINYHDSMGNNHHLQGDIELWISNDSSGLLMRMQGYTTSGAVGPTMQYSDTTDMSMELGATNIETLVLPPTPSSIVAWMSPGKYIQYNIQGSGYIDGSIVNHTGGVTWALPVDTKFRATVSANVTLRVVKGVIAWVDPWNRTIYAWVLHLMINNTQLLLPDLARSISYINTTLRPGSISAAMESDLLSELKTFNKTGLVADTWFIVDNATGTMFWPGMHLGALQTLPTNSTQITSQLGSLLRSGLGLELMSYFAQSVLYQGWSVSNPTKTQIIGPITNKGPDEEWTQTMNGTAHASITATGTKYLSITGGGSGLCWVLQPSVNVQISRSTTLNRTLSGYPFMGAMNYLWDNGTYSLTTSSGSYLDIERTTGFPLAMDVQTMFTYSGIASAMPYFWVTTGVTVFLDLSLSVPTTNIWFSNPPVTLKASVGSSGNVTTPPGYMANYSVDVWMSGAGNVTVTSSASAPPDAGAAPSGTLPFVFFDIHGIKTGSSVILYVYFNRTRVFLLGLLESSLALYTWNSTTSKWDALTTTHLDINATVGVLFAVLPHFSYFAVLGSALAGGGGAIPTTDILIAAVAVIVVLAAVVFMKRRGGGVK